MRRIDGAGDPIEGGRPSQSKLTIDHPLRALDVVDGDKTVFAAAIAQAGAIHRPRQPLASVDADLDAEGQPSLDAGVHEAEDGVDEVMIERQAFARTADEFQMLGGAVAKDVVARAGFD